MIEIKKILENKDQVIEDLKKRNIDFTNDINKVFDLETKRKNENLVLDNLRNEFNFLNKKLNVLNIERCKNLKNDIKVKENFIENLEKDIFDILVKIPNIPYHNVINGAGYDDNKVIFQKDFKHDIPEKALDHVDICKRYNIIDFDLGTKITERGFPVYINK